MERITPTAADANPLQARSAWTGVVRLLDEEETIELRGRELGRCTLVAEGDRLLPKARSVCVELELQGERVQFVANIEACVVSGGRALVMFRFGSTSPRGNDLLSAFSRNNIEDRPHYPNPLYGSGPTPEVEPSIAPPARSARELRGWERDPKRFSSHRGAAPLDPGTVLMRAPDGRARKRLWPGPPRVLH
jgi:hypothetical protein